MLQRRNLLRKLYALIGGVILGSALGGCVVADYSAREAYTRLKNDNTSEIVTEEFGTVEYKIAEGSGIPVLSIHGIAGGYDQGMMTAKSLLPEDRKIISISRFGYLGSDLPPASTPGKQCEAFIEVLDRENIETVVLLAASAGGTIAFKFALEYPDRTAGMILVGSAYPSKEAEEGPSGPPRFVYSDGMFQFMLNRLQGTMLKMFGISKEEYEEANEKERQSVRELFSVILPVQPRRAGIFNDEDLTNPDMVINYEDYPIERIHCPVLILHAENDPMAEISRMEAAAKRLENVRKIAYARGGHILFGHEEENKRHVKEFIVF